MKKSWVSMVLSVGAGILTIIAGIVNRRSDEARITQTAERTTRKYLDDKLKAAEKQQSAQPQSEEEEEEES